MPTTYAATSETSTTFEVVFYLVGERQKLVCSNDLDDLADITNLLDKAAISYIVHAV